MIKRLLSISLFLVLCLAAIAQDKYEATLARIQSMSRYEAIYHLIKYQQANPHFHAVYYQLGEIQSTLIQDYHPIRNYTQLHDCLYRTQLYYGNCMHYAKGETLRTDYYPTIPSDKRTIDYETLHQLATAKREHIQRLQTETDTLYNRYHRMVDNYETCRLLFTRFLQDYPGEKNAHLTLSDSSQSVLKTLIRTFEAFEDNLLAYQQAQDKPLTIHYTTISLYRLDGLTPVDFLQDTVAVWNYKDWSLNFLTEQNTFYQSYFSDIEQAFTRPNPVLTNRINRTDYQSFMIPLLQLFGNEALYRPCTSLDSLHTQYIYLQAAKKDVQLIEKRISDDDIRKYRSILEQRQLTDIPSILSAAQKQEGVLDSLYSDICSQFAASYEKSDSVLYYDEMIDLSILRRQLPEIWQEDALVVLTYMKNLMAVVLPKRVEFIPLTDLLHH